MMELDENKKFSKILVPIDGSESSFKAAQVAIAIAHKFKSQIICLHVIVSPQPHEYANLSGLVTPKQIDKIIIDVKKETNLWFDRIKEAENSEKNKIQILTDVILTGLTPYGEITQYAENKKINLIVIGTKGKTKLKKLLLGSTASGVITYAHCPVLVVK